ncbi:MAG TPA: phosphoglucosamine mutase [Gemmatimonadaceae bacterium]
MATQGLMESVSGVRGRVGDAMTPEVVARYALAFGVWSLQRSKSRVIVLGRDTRVSGPIFHRVAGAALEAAGVHVVDVGVAPTPTIQLAVEHFHAAGGLAITASHNPIEWNALKLISSSGMFLDAVQGTELRSLMHSGVRGATWDNLGFSEPDPGATQRHIDAILALSVIDAEKIRKHKFLVALDTCHGAGPTIMPELLQRLGCEVHLINGTPDGRFHRPPEPVAENLTELEQAVRETGAAIGFATDPDVDRLALVSDAGRAIGEDWTLALAARVVLSRHKGLVVTNLSTSRIVDDVAREFGASVERAPVGEVNVAARMRDRKAIIGGEGNGGVILPELHLGRDAPLAAALALQLLADAGERLSSVVARYPQYAIVKEKLDRPDAPLDTVYEALRAAFPDAQVDMQDGLRLAWSDRWVHVRPSGTEPIVRVIAEAPTRSAADELIRQCRQPLDALVAA